jgi:hypothetical protein
MRQPIVALFVTGLTAAVAGVVVAGVPSQVPGDGLIIADQRTALTNPSSTSTTVVPARDLTIASRTTTTSTSTVPSDPSTPSTAAAPVTSSTPPSTALSTSPIAVDTTDAPIVVVPRSAVDVGTANASGSAGVATRTADALRASGYDVVQPVDATVPSAVSMVYYVPGLESEASRLADDLAWGSEFIAPVDEMPALATDRTFQLVAMIGLDRG